MIDEGAVRNIAAWVTHELDRVLDTTDKPISLDDRQAVLENVKASVQVRLDAVASDIERRAELARMTEPERRKVRVVEALAEWFEHDGHTDYEAVAEAVLDAGDRKAVENVLTEWFEHDGHTGYDIAAEAIHHVAAGHSPRIQEDGDEWVVLIPPTKPEHFCGTGILGPYGDSYWPTLQKAAEFLTEVLGGEAKEQDAPRYAVQFPNGDELEIDDITEQNGSTVITVIAEV